MAHGTYMDPDAVVKTVWGWPYPYPSTTQAEHLIYQSTNALLAPLRPASCFPDVGPPKLLDVPGTKDCTR